MFGKKVPKHTKHQLKELLRNYEKGDIWSYLGIPESLGGSKSKIFNYVHERLNDWISGWPVKFLLKKK